MRSTSNENAAWIAKIRDYLGRLPAAPLVVIKEPKTTTVSGMWFEAARQAGFDVAAVIAVRHPEEIIGSLAKRADQQNYVEASPELTCAWWLKYSLLAERDTRGVPRVFVEYSQPSRGLAPGSKADFHGARDRSRRPGRGGSR